MVFGPLSQDQKTPLKDFNFTYKVVGFCDDVKPAIISMDEFRIVNLGAKIFEQSSGCKLHHDPLSNKCKFLLLGRWIGTLNQEDIPLQYLRISEHLDMLGVQLTAKYNTTRKMNGKS